MSTTFSVTQPQHSHQYDTRSTGSAYYDHHVAHQRQRRSANYKPTLWSYDFIQSLPTQFADVVYKTYTEKLKEELLQHFLSEEPEMSKVHIVDNISKLGLSSVFTKFIKETLDTIASNVNNTPDFETDILKTALSFRHLRQHGYHISQDVFVGFIDEMVSHEKKIGFDVIKGVMELFEASRLATEGEEILSKVKAFSHRILIDSRQYLDDNFLSQQITHTLKAPHHFGVVWFDVIHQIHAYEQMQDNIKKNNLLIKLAKLNFNITQAMLVQELKELSRWWNDLGLMKTIDFARDRLVESFLWTVGVAFEPQYALLRKCLTKVVTFILVIDDLYDIYGSFEELISFTRTVERWEDSGELQQLPECIKICFLTLQTTMAEIAFEIQKERGYHDDISLSLNTAWGDFCKALLSEAWWYNTNHMPSLEEYLTTAYMTSSGPLISLVTLLCTLDVDSESDLLKQRLRDSQDIVYYISLIVRLSNDLGTTAAEVERGDSPSSIMCFMAEANVTEGMARIHIKKKMSETWKKINKELMSVSLKQQTYVKVIINIARVCQFIYRDGDDFSVPKKDTQKKINALLFKPIQLSID